MPRDLFRGLLLFILTSIVDLSANTYTVSQTGDSGPGSLRQAIQDANSHAGADQIVFNIPGSGAHTIQPLSPLPEITDAVTIDGYTQPGASPSTNTVNLGSNAVLKIEIDGSKAGADVDGLVLSSGPSTVRGLAINRFGTGGTMGCAIRIPAGTGYLIEGNYLGTDITGTTACGNRTRGIMLMTENSTIRNNVISGNFERGIFLAGENACHNYICGNWIGVEATGTRPLANEQGIEIQRGGFNTIGGAAQSEKNIISGNFLAGITIAGTIDSDAPGNIVLGNHIGIDATGSIALGNGGPGIEIYHASNTRIGHNAELASANIICANQTAGIQLSGDGTQHTEIWANFIGADSTGAIQLGNQGPGVLAENGASENKIFYTIIKYNAGDGIRISGPTTMHNEFWRGRITGNGGAGILLENGGNDHMPAPQIVQADKDHVAGTAKPNSLIQIYSDAGDEGGYWQGWTFADADGNFNWKGEVTGPNVTVLATDTTLSNTSKFSLPAEPGINPVLLVTTTLESGPGSLRQALNLASGTPGDDIIRFDIPISDSGYDANHGVWVITPSFTINMPNGVTLDGLIHLAGRDSVPSIEIDGSILGRAGMTGFVLNDRDVLRGLIINRCAYGVWITGKDAAVEYCYIGTDPMGTIARSNEIDGVLLINGASGVEIRHNLISGNHSSGVRISGSSTGGNRIYHNRIGVNVSSTRALANYIQGVCIHAGGHDNLIEYNLISGNLSSGIYLADSGTVKNIIRANLIGTDASGTDPLGNGLHGVALYQGPCQNTIGPDNVIAFNSQAGVLIDGVQRPGSTLGNTITGNSIHSNATTGILNRNGGNTELPPPVVQAVAKLQVRGTASPGQRIEIFCDAGDQGHTCMGWTTADPAGQFSLNMTSRPLWANITATATDAQGNTSMFSAPLTTDVDAAPEQAPRHYRLEQNFPNPFNHTTSINCFLPEAASVSLDVINLRGEKIASLFDGKCLAGPLQIRWDATGLASGIYLLRLKAGQQLLIRKALLTK